MTKVSCHFWCDLIYDYVRDKHTVALDIIYQQPPGLLLQWAKENCCRYADY